jgi:cullin-associated NEDD8-dissociated protein 1
MNRSNAKVKLESIIPEAIPLLTTFLRKNHRQLKLTTINCLLAIYKNYFNFITIDQLKNVVIVELPSLLNENDLHISQVALKLITLISKSHGTQLISLNILQQVLSLIQSPLLQGLALETSIEFFITIVNHNQQGLQYKDIVNVISLNLFLILLIV